MLHLPLNQVIKFSMCSPAIAADAAKSEHSPGYQSLHTFPISVTPMRAKLVERAALKPD